MKKLKIKPIKIEAKIILKNLMKKISLNSNNFCFFKNKNKTIELNQDDMEVAIGIITNPIFLKK